MHLLSKYISIWSLTTYDQAWLWLTHDYDDANLQPSNDQDSLKTDHSSDQYLLQINHSLHLIIIIITTVHHHHDHHRPPPRPPPSTSTSSIPVPLRSYLRLDQSTGRLFHPSPSANKHRPYSLLSNSILLDSLQDSIDLDSRLIHWNGDRFPILALEPHHLDWGLEPLIVRSEASIRICTYVIMARFSRTGWTSELWVSTIDGERGLK